MTRVARHLAYLRDCHRADSRELALYDLLGRQAEHHHFVEGREELLDGTLDRLPVLPEWGEAAKKAVAIYRREKQLVYASFLIVARGLRVRGAEREVCAPLLWWPAELLDGPEGAGFLFVRPDFGEQQLNVPVLSALLGDEEDGDPAGLERLLEGLPQAPFDLRALDGLTRVLGEALPSLDLSALARFPEVLGEEEIRAALRRLKKGEARLLPATVCALVKNPPESQGVLFELDALARGESFSVPLQRLLDGAPAPAAASAGNRAAPARPRTGLVPAVLSEPQESVLEAGAREPLTFVVGPPGTGKSYTLAALALDHAGRGEPVLLAARTDEALDVLGEKIRLLAGTDAFVLRGGRGAHLAGLKDYLESLLRGVLPLGEVAQLDPDLVASELKAAEARVLTLERELARQGGLEVALGRAACGEGPLPGLRTAWLDWRLRRRRPTWELLDDYHSALEARSTARATALRRSLRGRIESVLAGHRADLTRFLKGLKARQSSRQDRLFAEADLAVLTAAFPIWMTTFSGLHQVMPLQPGLFSLAIVDEATQCDMASCLPAFQRARRAVVTGDPKQLRHLSFLSTERQRILADRHGLDEEARIELDYRNRSVLDLVEQCAGKVVFLDEHFRSRPHLIDFSNRHFYRDALKVMTHRPGEAGAGCIEVHPVAGGRRGDDGMNRLEAEALVTALAAWIEQAPPGTTAGVLSPFRDQVEHLQALISARVSLADLESRQLLVGTAYAFQGQERDVVFVSLGLDPGSPAAAMRWLERADVFNVSITRARQQMRLFSSLVAKDLGPESLLARYLAHAGRATPSPHEAGAAAADGDRFLGEVRAALVQAGFEVWPAWPLGGVVVDLVAVHEGRALGVDLVGHPGAFGAALPVERCRMLHRAGLRILPLPFSVWRRNPQACLARIATELGGQAATRPAVTTPIAG